MYHLNELPEIYPPVVGLDIETTGLDRFHCQVRAIGISDGNQTWILTENFERLLSLLTCPHVIKVVHNFDFDGTVLAYQYGAKFSNLFDTLIAERLLNNGRDWDNSLEGTLDRRYGILLDKSVRDTFIDYEGPLTEEQLGYLEGDCSSLVRLMEDQCREADELGLKTIFHLEMRDLLVTLDKTLTGCGFDPDDWDPVHAQILGVVEEERQELMFILGEGFVAQVPAVKAGEEYIKEIPLEEINFNSSQQVQAVMHQLGMKVRSADRATMERYADQHPFPNEMLDYKLWSKISTWHWQDYIDVDTGRIHPHWNQSGTITGRFSSRDPNMQQIPRPTEDGRPNLRALFQPLPGHKLLVADWSQQEPRILAHISRDERMIQAANSADIYLAFAKDVFGETMEKSDPRRQIMKVGVLATFYGVWAGSLAPKMHVTEKVAEDFQSRLFRAYPYAKKWGDDQIKGVVQYGYTQTVLGRRIYFPDLRPSLMWKLRKDARNYPIQGTGADMAKLAEVKIYDIIRKDGYDAHFMIGLHDELVLTCREDQAQSLYPKVAEAMSQAGNEICPTVQFPVEGVVSDTWRH